MHRPSRRPWIFLALTALATAAGGAWLSTTDDEGEAWLLTIARDEAANSATSLAPSRTWIALRRSGDQPRILTERFWSARQPSVSPDGLRFTFIGQEEESGPPEIWEMRLDGSAARMITAGHGEPMNPAYLSDERVIFSAILAGDDSPASRTVSLFSCDMTGSDETRLTFGPHRDRTPTMLPDGRVWFRRNPRSAGGTDRSIPMTIHADGTGVARFPEALSAMTPGPPAPMQEGPDGFTTLETVRAVAGTAPPILTSVVNPDAATGTLLCLNAYVSRDAKISDLPPGSIASVRVGILGPSVDPGSEGAAGEILGEAPVHPDGSFLIEVPADTPLSLTLLSEGGTPLASLTSGIWVRPNENRGCVGCHEPPDMAPENRQPLAVLEPPVPLSIPRLALGGAGSAAP
jgi:hypothetical protein